MNYQLVIIINDDYDKLIAFAVILLTLYSILEGDELMQAMENHKKCIEGQKQSSSGSRKRVINVH